MDKFIKEINQIIGNYNKIIKKQENNKDFSLNWDNYKSKKILKKAVKLLKINYRLWQLEDKCRDYKKSNKEIGRIKKKIDKLNQKRNDLKDDIDIYFIKKYKPNPPKLNESDPRLFASNTLGGILDRISIISLKIYYHKKIKNSKKEIEGKLNSLNNQFNFLVKTLEQNLNLIRNNELALMPLKEFKMYNNPKLNPKLRVEFLYLDFAIYSGCNQNCIYCRKIPDKKNTDIKNKIHTNLNHILSLTNPHILKISGYGEFTLLPNYIDILKKYSSKFEKIQLITNGTNLSLEDLKKIKKIKNINICFSLDGLKPSTNRLRTTNKKIIKNIKNSIEDCVKLKIPIEINTVLTKHNIDNYFSFVDNISFNSKGDILFYPFPLRDLQKGIYDYNKLMPTTKKVNSFKRKYFSREEKENKNLPPKGYLERLIKIMKGDFKKCRCFVPKINIGISPKGKWLTCPCAGTEKDHGKIKNFDNIRSIYDSIDHNLVNKVCKTCFNHYDIINVFMDNEVSLEEISKMNLFNTKKILNFLSYYKKKVK